MQVEVEGVFITHQAEQMELEEMAAAERVEHQLQHLHLVPAMLEQLEQPTQEVEEEDVVQVPREMLLVATEDPVLLFYVYHLLVDINNVFFHN
jgi:hypothetical protein